MQSRKNGYQKAAQIALIPVRFLYAFLKAVLKTIFLDLFRNIKKETIYTFNKEEKMKIKQELETKHLLNLVNERLKRVERLVYSIFNDPDYIKRDKGKHDLKELEKETK